VIRHFLCLPGQAATIDHRRIGTELARLVLRATRQGFSIVGLSHNSRFVLSHPIRPLPICMVQPALRAVLVTLVRFAMAHPPPSLPTLLRAVSLPAIAAPAHGEGHLACPTHEQIQDNRWWSVFARLAQTSPRSGQRAAGVRCSWTRGSLPPLCPFGTAAHRRDHSTRPGAPTPGHPSSTNYVTPESCLLAAGLTAGGMTVYTSEPWSEIRGFRWPSTHVTVCLLCTNVSGAW